MKKFLFLLVGLMFMLASCGGGEDEILDSPDDPNTPNNPTPAPKPNDPNTVVLTTAGTLKDSLEENYLDYRTLKVVGPINGDDVYWLREMMGGGEDESVKGKLTNLDLSEAKIVSGGNWYIDEEDAGKQYSSNNVVGKYMFANCDILSSIVLPNSVTTIGGGAFLYCTSLTSITIPDGVSSIENEVFIECTHLASVTIGKRVTSIGNDAFYGCDALTSVYISDLSQWCCIDFEDYYANPLITGAKLYLNNKELSELVIPNDITEIKPYTFCGGSITSVIIPDNVVSIGNSAFARCAQLESVTIGNELTSIGDYVFSNCDALTSIVIPDNITSIGEGAFYGCAQLESVTLGKGLTSIGYSAFRDCDALTSIAIPENTDFNNSFVLENFAFADCNSLSTVVYGKGPISMGESVFQGCDALTSIYIDSLTDWLKYKGFKNYSANPLHNGAKLYSNNKEISELIIPNDIYGIYDYAFFGSSITKVTIPTFLHDAYIGNYAFYGCDALTSVTIEGNSNFRIKEAAFQDCDALKSVTINVGYVYNYAFRDCDALTSVMLGKDVAVIKTYAFAYCPSLSECYCYATDPPTLFYCFYKTPNEKKLYVSAGCSSAYKSSEWGEYFDEIIEME